MRALPLFAAALAAAAFAGYGDGFEAQRAALLAKPRQLIADNDGCDMLYYSRKLPITEESFIASRIGAISGTRLDTLVYTPVSAGFGMFTALKAGEPLLHTIPYQQTTNAAAAFRDRVGKDCLEMAIDFCRREKREIFVGIRLNDTHDSYHEGLFPSWKRENPDCLFGAKDRRPPRCAWSAVDYANPKVRARMLSFMRQFFENYDIDGVCYDFNRHFHLFKSVAWGRTEAEATASAAQLDLMSRFMRELKDLADECGRKRGRPILVMARVYDSLDYIRAAGIDLERWLDERSVDILSAGGYFRLNPWRVMADVAHRHGVRFHASMDESRIGWLPTPFHPYGYLPGRNGDRFAAARIAEAMSEGADGIFFFNTQNRSLHAWASIDPRATEGLDKSYFAVERGSGGALPWNYVFDGAKYSNYCRLDPWHPQEIEKGGSYPFAISVGDDFASPVAKARPPRVTARAMMNYTVRADVRLEVNGRTLPAASFVSDNTTNGVFSFDVPADIIRRGRNDFRLLAPDNAVSANADGKILFVDFRLDIAYPAKARESARRTFCNPLPLPELPKSVYIDCGGKGIPHRQVSDPNLIREAGKWYLYPSAGFVYESGDDGGTWVRHESADGLEGHGPGAVKHRGKYYYIPRTDGEVYVGERPTGPFRSLGRIALPAGVPGPADPMLFSDEDGRLYFYWGCTAQGGIWGCELDAENPTRVVSRPVELIPFDPVGQPWECCAVNPKNGWLEGAWVLRINGRYCLTFSAGGAQHATYAMGAYWSESPLSGFKPQRSNPFFVSPRGLVTGTGHGSVVQDERGDLWVSYCITVGNLHWFERRVGLDRLELSADGEIKPSAATSEPQLLPAFGRGSAGWRRIPVRTPCADAADDSLQTVTWMLDPPCRIDYEFLRPSTVRAFRLCWRENGYDPDHGVMGGPFRYRLSVRLPDGTWKTLCDASANDRDLLVDYRETESVKATAARLELLSVPAGIKAGVSDFALFGVAAD